jgi:hypothetical protein
MGLFSGAPARYVGITVSFSQTVTGVPLAQEIETRQAARKTPGTSLAIWGMRFAAIAGNLQGMCSCPRRSTP